jgi:hypothetical protein
MDLMRWPKDAVLALLRASGYQLVPRDWLPPMPAPTPARPAAYDDDGLAVYGKTLDFLHDPRFERAYQRGWNSGHRLADFGHRDVRYRVAVIVWAARHGLNLTGDFVECGVNTGIFSLAICDYLDFATHDRTFWLFDTFRGYPTEQMSAREATFLNPVGAIYPDCYAQATANFAPFPNARLVRGIVPDILSSVAIERVAYLSVDMNVAYAERAALEFFWPKLSPGALVVLDDYAWNGCDDQRSAANEMARSAGCEILTLPTGQGLLIKP